MSLFNIFKRKKNSVIEESYDLEEQINEVSNSNIIHGFKTNQLEFVDSSKLVFTSLPIQLAKDVQLNFRKTVEDSGEKFTFPLCPGMFDYSRIGYIMPAWTDIHIKVNKAGMVVVVGGGRKHSAFQQPIPMDSKMVNGLFQTQDIPLTPFNIGSPWKIFTYDKNISALLLPAWYHSPVEFLENFYVYPGVVDYDTFNVCNVILAPKKKVEYTIKSGDPLLHIIPIYNRDISCGYGPPTVEQESLINYDPAMHRTQYYRKTHSAKKNFALKEKE
jgi:hypothetical protein